MLFSESLMFCALSLKGVAAVLKILPGSLLMAEGVCPTFVNDTLRYLVFLKR